MQEKKANRGRGVTRATNCVIFFKARRLGYNAGILPIWYATVGNAEAHASVAVAARVAVAYFSRWSIDSNNRLTTLVSMVLRIICHLSRRSQFLGQSLEPLVSMSGKTIVLDHSILRLPLVFHAGCEKSQIAINILLFSRRAGLFADVAAIAYHTSVGGPGGMPFGEESQKATSSLFRNADLCRNIWQASRRNGTSYQIKLRAFSHHTDGCVDASDPASWPNIEITNIRAVCHVVNSRAGIAELANSNDVQQFNRVVQDKLESKMKGTNAKGAIAKLFLGKLKSYIKCANVDYESSRQEHPTQLPDLQGLCGRRYACRREQYQAECLGLQDAKKGIIFESFPPVLHLQLKRFEYDMQQDSIVKVNDHHSFPFEIDLGEFLNSSADRSKPWTFMAATTSLLSSRTVKLDGSNTTTIEWCQAGFGEELWRQSNQWLTTYSPTQPGRSHEALPERIHVGVYRESAIDEVLAPLTDKDTPPQLTKVVEEKRQLELKKQE
ncbi:hypothetical protein B0H19DRAFT_1230010 [Mycena capillaripes]|nr:hypothetical protein B0H19DRAFT_1230010 [Mycena capillaripes]